MREIDSIVTKTSLLQEAARRFYSVLRKEDWDSMTDSERAVIAREAIILAYHLGESLLYTGLAVRHSHPEWLKIGVRHIEEASAIVRRKNSSN